jgi:hypothetical protein
LSPWQTPFVVSHRLVLEQWSFDVHDDKHLPPMQAYGAHPCRGPASQMPSALQRDGSVTSAPEKQLES